MHSDLLEHPTTTPLAAPARTVSIAVSASFTATPLVAPFQQARAALGAGEGAIALLAYGQVIEPLLASGSPFARNQGGLNLCLVRLADWSRGGDPDEVGARAAAFASAVRGFAAQSFGHLAVLLCPSPPDDRTDACSQAEARLYQDLSEVAGVATCRVSEWFHTYGVGNPFDPHGDALAHVPYTPDAFAALGLGLARIVRSLLVKPRKVIAVDCDFTLWEGACGDLPPAELGLAPRFLEVQRFLAEKRRAGFMLAICSRNDAESVERVFRERAPELALARTDFVAARIGWGPKSQHLAALARSLGVSLDSFILVDDDPFVCAEVRASLPEVSVVHLPIDEDGAARLRLTPELDHFFVTDEDRTRTDSYRGDALRAHEAGQVTSVADLNHRLETSIEVLPADRRHWPRIEQLIARTNQFTSGTLQPGDVRAALIGGAQAWVVAVRDRFGDYGVVAAAITGSHPEALVVEGLAMSCRVLNRGVDHALVDHLQEAARQAGLREVRARLIDRGRNRLARDFLAGRAWLVRREGDEETYVMRCDGEEKIGAPAEVRAALQGEAAQ